MNYIVYIRDASPRTEAFGFILGDLEVENSEIEEITIPLEEEEKNDHESPIQ